MLLSTVSMFAIKRAYTINFDQKDFIDTIPIRFVGNRIIMQANIKGTNFDFIFDTGASYTSVIESGLLKSLRVGVPVYDANANNSTLSLGKIEKLKIGKLSAEDVTCLVLPDSNQVNKMMKCSRLAGIIGADLMNHRILKIDVKAGYMVLTDKKDFFKDDEGFSMREEHELATPSFRVRLDECLNVEDFILDTGAQHFMCINNKLRDELTLRNPLVFNSTLVEQTVGSTSSGISGFAKEDTLSRYRLHSVELGDFCFHNVTLYSGPFAGSFGADILKYGSIILDQKSHKTIFQPYREYLNRDSSSITLEDAKEYFTCRPSDDIMYEGRWYITTLWPSAQETYPRLELGDELVRLDGKPIREMENVMYHAYALKSKKHTYTFEKADGRLYDVVH